MRENNKWPYVGKIFLVQNYGHWYHHDAIVASKAVCLVQTLLTCCVKCEPQRWMYHCLFNWISSIRKWEMPIQAWQPAYQARTITQVSKASLDHGCQVQVSERNSEVWFPASVDLSLVAHGTNPVAVPSMAAAIANTMMWMSMAPSSLEDSSQVRLSEALAMESLVSGQWWW